MRLVRILAILLPSLAGLSGCFFKDRLESHKEFFDFNLGSSTCKLNPERLKKILQEDISADLHCLKDNLTRFTTLVRRKDDAHIERSELEHFVTQFFPEISHTVRDSFKFFFDIVSFLLKTPNNKIEISKLDTLLELAFLINSKDNRSAYSALRGMNSFNYWERRPLISAYLTDILDKFKILLGNIQGRPSTIDMTALINAISKHLPINTAILEWADATLFIKKLLVGGKVNILTHQELINLTSKTPTLFINTLDIIHIKGRKFSSHADEMIYIYRSLRTITASFITLNPETKIVSHEKLLWIAGKFLHNMGIDIQKMSPAIKKMRTKLLGSSGEYWNYRDIKTITDWGTFVPGMFYFNAITYEHFRDKLLAGESLENTPLPKLPQYEVFTSKDRLKRFWKRFAHITSNYRHFRTAPKKHNVKSLQLSELKENFATWIYRNEEYEEDAHDRITLIILNDISLLHWLLQKVINVYGESTSEEHQIDATGILHFLGDAKEIFESMGLWIQSSTSLANTIVTTADHFQYQSDGSGLINVDEITEYILTILQANKLGTILYLDIKKRCPMVGEDKDAFEVPCYRTHFLRTFFQELNYDKYFRDLLEDPLLKEEESQQDYLINLERYSRKVYDEELPIGKTDLLRLMMAFSNLEDVFIRFDADESGLVEGKELDRAFEVFKRLIRQVAGGRLDNRGDDWVKSTFLYLIKKAKMPTVIDLIAFHYANNKDDITCSRINIAKILGLIEKKLSPRTFMPTTLNFGIF